MRCSFWANSLHGQNVSSPQRVSCGGGSWLKPNKPPPGTAASATTPACFRGSLASWSVHASAWSVHASALNNKAAVVAAAAARLQRLLRLLSCQRLPRSHQLVRSPKCVRKGTTTRCPGAPWNANTGQLGGCELRPSTPQACSAKRMQRQRRVSLPCKYTRRARRRLIMQAQQSARVRFVARQRSHTASAPAAGVGRGRSSPATATGGRPTRRRRRAARGSPGAPCSLHPQQRRAQRAGRGAQRRAAARHQRQAAARGPAEIGPGVRWFAAASWSAGGDRQVAVGAIEWP